MLDGGDQKVNAIKIYREHTGVGLKEAKEAIDSAPAIILETSDFEVAEALAEALEEVGASVEVGEWTGEETK